MENGFFQKRKWIIMNRHAVEWNSVQAFFLPETLWSTRSATTPLYAERFRGIRCAPASDRHPFYELTVVLNGSGKLRIGGTVRELQPDTVVCLPPGTPHREEAEERLDTLWIGFRSPLPELSGSGPLLLESHRAAETALACWRLAAGRIPESGFELDGILLTLIGLLLRGRANRHAPWQETVLDYLESHCHEECSVPRLARRFHCSESYFHRRFRALTGMPPNEYLIRLRLKKVMFHLQHTSLPLCEIAPLCGFSDPSYLSRLFHRRMGISAGDFRKKRRSTP